MHPTGFKQLTMQRDKRFNRPGRGRAFSVRGLVCAALLALAPVVAPAQETPRPIEEQMSAEQFKAAGLDQLSAQQLAVLNAWLNREIDSKTAQAVATVKQQVEQDDRGLMDFGSREPVVAHIEGAFHGFNKGRRYTLDNGQVWEQVDSASLAGVELTAPKVEISPPLIGNSWYLKVEGYNTRAKVRRVE